MCYQAERFNDALEAYSKVLEGDARALTTELRARLHYRIARCHKDRAAYRAALEHLDAAREALPRHLDHVRLAKIHSMRGIVLQEMGQYRRARRYLEWAQKLLRGTNEHEELAWVELQLGSNHIRTGGLAEARDCYLNSLTTYRRIENRMGECNALNNLAVLHKTCCEFREAVRYLHLARELSETIGFRRRLMSIHLNLGIIHFKLGKWELCEENLATAETLAQEVGSRQCRVRVRLALANLEIRRRHWDRVEELLAEAKAWADEEGYARERILASEFLGEFRLVTGDRDGSVEVLEPVLAEARALAPNGDLVSEILRRLAEARLAREEFDEALALAKESAAGASRAGDRYEEAVALRVVGLALHHLGSDAEGEKLIRMSLDSLGEIGDGYQKGLTHLEYGKRLAAAARTRNSTGDLERANVQFQRAYGAFLDLGAESMAARAAYERSTLECDFQRFDEATAFLEKARRVLPTGETEFARELDLLGARIEETFARRWSTGGDVLTSLREIKGLFQGTSDTAAALKELTRLAVDQTHSDRGCVAQLGPDGEVEVVAAFGWTPEAARELLADLGRPLGKMADQNRPIRVMEPEADPRFAAAAGRAGVRGFVAFPFQLGEDRPGLLYVDTTGEAAGGYHQGDLQILAILANLAALSAVERLNSRLARENEELKRKIAEETGPRFVTANPELLESIRLVHKVANSPVSILISGETGTGKGLLAQVIHQSSNRREKPFIQINCAALPEQLLESELFGHVKGAFTGASYNKVGLFAEADGGTLFLDEVDKTSLAVQAKLLHVMDTKEVRPVGSVKTARVDTRVLCATNTDLRRRIEDAEFLEDLYYRLNDFTISVSPLRRRPEDVPLLVDHFLRRFAG